MGKGCWPPKFVPESSIEVASERRKVDVPLVVHEDPMGIGNVIEIARNSNLMKYLELLHTY